MAARRPMVVLSFVFSAMLLLMSVPRLAAVLGERSDIWWTPMERALSPAAAKDRVEIYVRGEPLDRLLDSGTLLEKRGAEAVPLAASDVALRLNNWDRHRAERSPFLLFLAATAGAGFVFLGFGLVGARDRGGVSA